MGTLLTSILDSDLFQILATFVAINSLIYATLAVLKVLPRISLDVGTNGRNRRRQNRSIHPDEQDPSTVDPLSPPAPSPGPLARR
jgi:hypothetical protein